MFVCCLSSPKIFACQGRFFLNFDIYLQIHFGKSLENFHVYFFNYAQTVERCQSIQAKSLEKTQLKSLITFDRVIVLTSNLIHMLLMSNNICWHKHFLWWRHQNFWRAKNEKIILSFLARHSGLNFCIFFKRPFYYLSEYLNRIEISYLNKK